VKRVYFVFFIRLERVLLFKFGFSNCKAIGPIRSLESSSIIDIAVDEVRSINFQDFIDAMQQVRASVSQDDLEAYYKWNSQFGTMAIPK